MYTFALKTRSSLEEEYMSIDKYYKAISQELSNKSEEMRIGFSTHNLSAGENREEVVGKFLTDNLPKSFKVDSGLILSMEGEFSNQADLLIVDHMSNAPLYPDYKNKVWLAESVYAMVEVKTKITNAEIKDIIPKCRKFKKMRREYQSVPSIPRIQESLFIIWGFDGSSPETLKKNIIDNLKDVPVEEQPDFIIIPNSMIATCGEYRKISEFGKAGSLFNQEILSKNPGKNYEDIFEVYEFIQSKDNSVLIFLTWLTSWLKSAGYRSAPIASYLEASRVFGELI